MNRLITSTAIPARALKIEVLANMTASFENFCLASGIEALAEMMESDTEAACGPRHARGKERRAHRWGKAKGKIGFHGGKVEIERPRLRSFDGKELALASWEAAQSEDWLQMGDEPDADQRLDAQVQTFGSLARGRCAGAERLRSIEIRRLATFCCAVGGSAEAMDGG
jgi:hypothetical protein